MITPPKTVSGKRIVALSNDDLQVLSDHRKRQIGELESLLAVKAEWEDPGFVFTSEVGTLVHPRNFERAWYTLRDKAGVTPVRLHDLRHFHVSLLVNKDIDLRTIADRVGHVDPAFTLRVYSHMLAEARPNAAISLNELLAETQGAVKGPN